MSDKRLKEMNRSLKVKSITDKLHSSGIVLDKVIDKLNRGSIAKRKAGLKSGGRIGFRAGKGAGKGVEKKKKINKKIYKYKSKDKRFTDEQASMHMDIKEKSHGNYPKSYFAKQLKKDKHGRFRGKVYDASPTILAKAGITGKQGKVGLPIYGSTSTHTKGKLTDFKVKPYSGSVKTGFKGYDMKDPSKKGFNKGGRAGFQHGGRTNLLEELGRVEAEPSNRNRRAEVSRVHRELNKGYKSGGAVLKGKKVGCQIK